MLFTFQSGTCDVTRSIHTLFSRILQLRSRSWNQISSLCNGCLALVKMTATGRANYINTLLKQIKGTLFKSEYSTKSIKLLRHWYGQLSSREDCQSASAALALLKLITEKKYCLTLWPSIYFLFYIHFLLVTGTLWLHYFSTDDFL